MPILAFLAGLVLFLLGSLPIRSSQKAIFGAWFGTSFSDNPKYLYLYANRHSDKRCIWITGDRSLRDALKEQGFEVYQRWSWLGIWHQLTSKTFFVCVSSRDCNPFCQGLTARVVMMNHGMPMKAIGFDVDHGMFGRIKNRIRRHSIDNYEIICSNGKAFNNCLASAYQVTLDRIVSVPAPRLDGFAAKPSASPENGVLRALWLPTHRSEGRDTDVIHQGLKEICALMSQAGQQNFQMAFKPHPYDVSLLKERDRFPEIEFATETDVYRLLAETDLLISDYSSVIFDFAHLGRPILGFMPDYENYRSRIRDFYFDPKEIYTEHYEDSTSLVRAVRDIGLGRRAPSLDDGYLSSKYRAGRCSEVAWKLLVDD